MSHSDLNPFVNASFRFMFSQFTNLGSTALSSSAIIFDPLKLTTFKLIPT